MSDTLGWKVGETKPVADYGKFKVLKLEATSPRTGETIEFKIIDRAPSVLIVPVTEDGRIILVEQFRPGVQQASLELPAGLLDPGETPEQGAKRELEEETGFCAASFEKLTTIFHDPAILTSRVTILFARGCKPAGEKNQDEGEDVHTQLYAPQEVDAFVRDGRITHGLIIAAWLLARPAI